MPAPVFDYVIIGAGPAGLQFGQHLATAGRGYLILEAGAAPGTFFRRFPRHRQLISINKVHAGTDDPELRLRMDWNSLLSSDPRLLFTRYSQRYLPAADDFVRYLADYADTLALHVRYDTRVSRIERAGHGFDVRAAGETFAARTVVVATGVGSAYVPPIRGIELVEQYATVSIDPDDFVDQRVLIIGKGNSAFETAENLIESAAVIHVAGPSSIRMAWKTHFVGHLRAVNNNFLDTYQLKSQNAILDGTVRSVERDGAGFVVRFAFSRANEVVKGLYYDRVILCTGFRFDPSIFAADCRPRLFQHDRFPVLTSGYESASAPGIYFAGTLMQHRDFKRSTSGFIHGFRYAVRALSRILEQREHDVPWPAMELDGSPEALTQAIIGRVNRTSALWQQFGVLGDVITVTGDGSPRYLEEVPVDYVHDGGLGPDGRNVFVVTLEYGPDHDKVDPFDITVARVAQDDTERAVDAAYLHPVIRHHCDGRLLAVHHLAENLENEWNKPAVHRDPLIAFLGRQLALEPA